MKIGQFIDVLLISILFLQSYKINQLEKVAEIKTDIKGFLYYVFRSIRYVVLAILFISLTLSIGLILSMIIDLSTNGLSFAGEYKIYYWADVFEWAISFFR